MQPAVVESHIERASFANEPVTVSRLSDGSVVRQLGGPNARGGITFVLEHPLPTIPSHQPGKWTYVSPQGTWPASALPVTLVIGLPRSRDLGTNEDGEVDVAARTWGRVSCTAFRATVSGTTSAPPGDDGVNGVYFEDATWPTEFTPDAIANTVVHVDANNNIYDTDIYVDGATYTFSLQGEGAIVDFRSIATHEIGHVLGLGESTDPTATMYTAYPPGVSWRSLEQDDDNGVCTLYPGTGDLLGCEATACPSSFVCVARDCDRVGDQRMTCSPCEPSITGACEGAGDSARCVAYANGYACGRPCTSTTDCGQGFTCLPTTSVGHAPQELASAHSLRTQATPGWMQAAMEACSSTSPSADATSRAHVALGVGARSSPSLSFGERRELFTERLVHRANVSCNVADDVCKRDDVSCSAAGDVCERADVSCNVADDVCKHDDVSCNVADDVCKHVGVSCNVAGDVCKHDGVSCSVAGDVCEHDGVSCSVAGDARRDNGVSCNVAGDRCALAEGV